ncbi:MAG: glycosyltransferase [Gammaproteobacteria bacterium]|nr:glycosyltransferase [Gammaproteobacteria bacterium]
MRQDFRNCGCDVIDQAYSHCFEFFPWLLTRAAAPPKTNIVVTNTWNGFAFSRPGTKMVAVDRLFVLDPALTRYKSRSQRVYHDLFVRRHVMASARQADAVVAVSDYTAEVFAHELKLPKPQVILNAVDTEFTPSPSGKQPRDGRPIRLLYVGNLSRRKGADLLAPIMENLGSGYELYYTAGLRASALKERNRNMYPLGQLDQTQIRDQYRDADLLLFPHAAKGFRVQ